MSEWNCYICQYEEVRENFPFTWTERWGVKPDWLCAYAQDDIHLAGLCLFSVDKDEKLLNVHFIHVLTDDRRKGVATLLMQHIFREYGNGMKCRICFERSGTSDVLHQFLCSFGFMARELNASIYHVDRMEWVRNVLPRIKMWASRAIDCTYINWKNMDISMQSTWHEIYAENAVSEGLNPECYKQNTYEKLFFYTSDGKPLGWIVVSLKHNQVASLDVIYILPSFRGGSTVFTIYGQTTDFVLRTWPGTTGLHFQLDTQDTQLCRFYARLLRDTRFTCRKKYRYELSVLPTT